MSKFNAIGIMSGTSLDGVDLAFCSFSENKPGAFEIVQGETSAYSVLWTNKLANASQLNAVEFEKLKVDYSLEIAHTVDRFRNKFGLPRPDILAFHGHTIFHRPDLGFTTQLGCGATLATSTGIPTVFDFRSGNVALGGQGAPLVPIGDAQLFPMFDACVNLGGFANISLKDDGKITAFDICPANIVLNEYALKCGQKFDDGGSIAKSGKVHENTLAALNKLNYYSEKPPKSLGREWYEECLQPLLRQSTLSDKEILATVCEHIAVQVAKVVPENEVNQVLLTGGGVFNTHLINRIKHHTQAAVIIPEDTIVEFKEALIFAYMGWLRMLGKTNCQSHYTGSSRDLCAGSIHLA